MNKQNNGLWACGTKFLIGDVVIDNGPDTAAATTARAMEKPEISKADLVKRQTAIREAALQPA